MKALSLWQPWATLIAIGAKRVETRDWPAPPWVVGGRIAIHAAKTDEHLPARHLPLFVDVLDGLEIPLGAVVATAVLSRCAPITEAGTAELEETNPAEHAFGYYAPGRFAWVLRDVERLVEPVPWRGYPRLFELPDDVLAGAAVQTEFEL